MKSPFESKKEFVGPWIIVMALGCLLLLTGCDEYEEGDKEANKAFDLMTVQEKIFYDAVEKEWSPSRLIAIRDSVRTRESAPLELTIPFIDIANVIKTNNDITLKVPDNWQTDSKNRAILARWDRIEGSWYVWVICQ